MTKQDIYVLVLCLIVFILLAGLSTVMITSIVKMTVKIIRHGLEDENIKTEYAKEKASKTKAKSGVFDYIVSLLLCVVLLAAFAFSLYVNVQEDHYFENIPTFKVVNTGSMAKKHEKNTYLSENGLNNQIDAFDVILTYKLPKEEDLQLYDIVVYEVDDMLIVHRIVGIEEPNKDHPDERYFLLQGDAVESPDRFPVLYSQMRAVYRGQKIPFVGTFVTFMQSPAGWLCVLLIVAGVVITPIVEKRINEERKLRLIAMGIITEDGVDIADALALAEASKGGAFAHLQGKRDTRTFAEKLSDASEEVQARYAEIEEYLLRIEKISVKESKKYRSFRSGRLSVARFALRGKTLNIYLGLDPKEYAESKYIFTDLSEVKAAASFPMRIKLTSDRQVRWTKELLEQLCEKNALTVAEKPVAWEELAAEEETPFYEKFTKARDMRTITERLAEASEEVRERYDTITDKLKSIKGIRVIEGRKQLTFKSGNAPVARIALRGKTLNVYLGLAPADFEGTKYKFTDASEAKKYANYPMRVKLTSARQTRWTCELLEKLVEMNGLTVLEESHEDETSS